MLHMTMDIEGPIGSFFPEEEDSIRGTVKESFSSAVASPSRSYGWSWLVPHINPLISSFIRLLASSSSSSGLILPSDNDQVDTLENLIFLTFAFALNLILLLNVLIPSLNPKSS
jgi:hypothetical protein